MLRRLFVFLFFILILIFSLVFPPMALAQDTSTTDTTSSAQQGNKQFRVEISKKGFNNSSEELRLEAVEGQAVEIIFVYAEDASQDNNPHVFFIGSYKIQTDTLDKDNPEVTVKFTADKTGEFSITCIMECAGHNNLQNAKLIVTPAAAGSQPLKTAATLIMDAPDQAETGQLLTLAALVKDDLDKPVSDIQVKFFIESDFFVKGMMEIGETVTNEQGLAKIDYIPSQAGVIKVVARYESGSGSEPVETKREVNITGSSQSFYNTLIGIQFPNSFLIWMIALAVIVIGIWGTFLYVLSQVLVISNGTRTKRLVITLMITVAVVCIILVQILLTPELQYHFALLP
ncbi:MAG: hypothetical protein ACYCXK_00565 [Candidatus Humimicrobiaceae bacterium]